jgi:hypothetical protein
MLNQIKLRPVFLFNGHGIHEKTRKNKCLKRNFSVYFRGFRGNNIDIYHLEGVIGARVLAGNGFPRVAESTLIEDETPSCT